jgi:hypothetical protein
VAYAHSTVSGTFNQHAAVDITIAANEVSTPWMAIDGALDGTTRAQPFLVAGWAVDAGAATGPGVDAVHVWAFPAAGGSGTFVGVASYGAPRSDIAAVFGNTFLNAAYSVSVTTLPPGTHKIVVYMRSTVTGSFSKSHVVTVTVP